MNWTRTTTLWNSCRAGPKNYGYQTKLGHVECKVRGFRLNSEGKSQLNYNVMRQNVLDEIQKPLLKPRQTQVVKTHQIVRDAKTYELYTFPRYKRYQLVYDKRVVDPAVPSSNLSLWIPMRDFFPKSTPSHVVLLLASS